MPREGKYLYSRLLAFSAILLFQSACPQGILADHHIRLFNGHLKGGYFELESEYETNEQSDSYDAEYLKIRPKVHLDFAGFAYHPNFLDYTLALELGTDVEQEDISFGSASKKDRSDTSPFQSYNGRALILKEKKLSGAIFGNHQRIRRNNSFYTDNSYLQTGYGTQLNYDGEIILWKLIASHDNSEKLDSLNPYNSETEELRVTASNDRGIRNRTRLDYRIQDFLQQYSVNSIHSGTRNNARLIDSSFFRQGDLHLTSRFTYNDIDLASGRSHSSHSLREMLTAQHTDNLNSSYSYSYSSSETADINNKAHRAGVSLNHKLYESLTSTASVDAYENRSSALDASRYGIKLSESYTKRIGDSSRLNLGVFVSKHFEERDAGAPEIFVIDESFTLGIGSSALLNQPNILRPSIFVTDSSGNPLVENTHYAINTIGSTVEIVRLPAALPDTGTTMLVDYDYLNPGTGSFKTLKNRYNFRYSIFEQLLSIYGHLHEVKNSGDDHLLFEELTESVLGIGSRWKWFSAGIEYGDYDSTRFPRETLQIHQSANFSLPWSSSLHLSARQSTTKYPETAEEIQRQIYRATYQDRLTSRLLFNIGGAAHHSRAQNNKAIDRDFFSAEAKLDYYIGNATLSVTYRYNEIDYSSKNEVKNFMHLRIRRRF